MKHHALHTAAEHQKHATERAKEIQLNNGKK
jgi:hypothetical protein